MLNNSPETSRDSPEYWELENDFDVPEEGDDIPEPEPEGNDFDDRYEYHGVPR